MRVPRGGRNLSSRLWGGVAPTTCLEQYALAGTPQARVPC